MTARKLAVMMLAIWKDKPADNHPFPHHPDYAVKNQNFRIRQGNYRISHQIIDDKLIINVVKIGQRRNIYKI